KALAERARAEKDHVAAAEAGERAREQDARRSRLAERTGAPRAGGATLAEPFDGSVPELDELRASAQRARALSTRAAELRTERQHLAQAERDLDAARQRVEPLAPPPPPPARRSSGPNGTTSLRPTATWTPPGSGSSSSTASSRSSRGRPRGSLSTTRATRPFTASPRKGSARSRGRGGRSGG